jgi:hypothetical protein
MAFGKKTESTIEIQVLEVKHGKFDIQIIGTTPLIYNCMSEKVRGELLFPAPKKTAATKAESMKHDPLSEYRDSVYRMLDKSAPTLLGFPASAFKQAMESAAKRIPGVVGEDVKQLIYVDGPEMKGNMIPVYGVPQMLMSVVRCKDINRTPDVRTRAIVPSWCCRISVKFITPQFTTQAVGNLIAAAGVFIGVGDWRQEKGSNNHGLFRTDGTVSDFDAVAKGNGRTAQLAALDRPVAYDIETERLFAWFENEVKVRDRTKQLKSHATGNGKTIRPGRVSKRVSVEGRAS